MEKARNSSRLERFPLKQVSSKFIRFAFVTWIIRHRENTHSWARVLAPKPFKYFEPAALRQLQIQDHQIRQRVFAPVAVRPGSLQIRNRLVAILRMTDKVQLRFLLQCALKKHRVFGAILNQQNVTIPIHKST